MRRHPPFYLLAVTVAVLTGCQILAFSQAHSDALNADEVKALIENRMTELEIPGVSVAISWKNGETWSAGYGLADLENDVPMTAQSMMRIGAITMPLSAHAVYRLVEDGALGLRDPIQNHCEAYPDKAHPVLIEDLLGHLAGLRHRRLSTTVEPHLRELYTNQHYYLAEKAVLALYAEDPLIHKPGKFRFSLPSYVLLGCAIETLTGKTYNDAMAQLVFDPLGMSVTQVDNPYTLTPNRAGGYCANAWPENSAGIEVETSFLCTQVGFEPKTASGLRPRAPEDLSRGWSASGLLSSADDMSRFMVSLLDQSLLSQSSYERMLSPAVQRTGETSPFGLGIGISPDDELTYFAAGTEAGASAYMIIYPERGIGVAVFSNLEDQPDRAELVNAIADLIKPYSR